MKLDAKMAMSDLQWYPSKLGGSLGTLTVPLRILKFQRESNLKSFLWGTGDLIISDPKFKKLIPVLQQTLNSSELK